MKRLARVHSVSNSSSTPKPRTVSASAVRSRFSRSPPSVVKVKRSTCLSSSECNPSPSCRSVAARLPPSSAARIASLVATWFTAMEKLRIVM
jgi:hypothetical protein